MNLLNIIDKIYENEHFGTFLLISIIVLIILFLIVLFLGKKDAQKQNKPLVEEEEDVKDITFDIPDTIDPIKEDVTFEMPLLTKNLENFKKNLEEEMQKEDMAEVIKTSGLSLKKENKPVKILDMSEISDTQLIQVIDENEVAKDSKENK